MVFDSRLTNELTQELKDTVAAIAGLAAQNGLDFFPVIFQMVNYDQMSEIAAYGGFPTRYPHWRFGMEFDHLSKSYEYGLSLIYEMVINTDPCYAYLLKSNSLVDQKTVISHVYGHADFFKNNYCFQHTNRKMLDEMANHGSRIRRYIEEVGFDEVEHFLDVCLSLDNLIDQHNLSVGAKSTAQMSPPPPPDQATGGGPLLQAREGHRSYMDSYMNPKEFIEEQKKKQQLDQDTPLRFPAKPQRDVLKFLLDHGQLNGWQRDVLNIIRKEAYYFAPQGQTKIMNEGWAVYWHSKLMTHGLLNDKEVVDYCDHYAAITATSPTRLNPYKLGVELMRYIEHRWDTGKHGVEYITCDDPNVRRRWQGPQAGQGQGLKKLFEVRKIYNDITFIDEFLDEDFCEDAKLFHWAEDRRTGQQVLLDRNFVTIKKHLLDSLTNFGQPIIEVEDGNFRNRGELLLKHVHNGRDLRVDWAGEVLKNLFFLWKRPVHVCAPLEGEVRLISYDGSDVRVELDTVQAAS